LADKLAGTAPSAAPGIDRLRLQTSLGNALIWANGYHAPETAAAFARAANWRAGWKTPRSVSLPITVFGQGI